MKKNMTMGKKLFMGIGAVTAITLCISGYSILTIRSFNANVRRLTKLSQKQLLAGNLRTAALELMTAERELLAVGSDKTSADRLNEEAEKQISILKSNLTALSRSVETAEGRQNVDKIRAAIDSIAQVRAQIAGLLSSGKTDEATLLFRTAFSEPSAVLTRAAGRLREQQVELELQTAAAMQNAAARSDWVMSLAILLGLAISVAVILVVHRVNVALRQFLTELTNNSEQVASASSQIAATSQSLSQGSSEQAASLEEISASMEEMTAMSKRNSENSGEMTGMMTQTATQVERSNLALQEMVASMKAIKSSSEKVAGIIKTIDEIAFQTNILALNAAVEAARAGEAGMGFAVVADEVRNLAQRSAVAAKDTAGLIAEAINSSNQGAQKLEEVDVAIRAITESASKVKNLAEEVNESSKQQTVGIQQTSTALTEVSKVTQSTTASAEESAAASEELSAQAQSMRDAVRLLHSLVGGSTSPSRSLSSKPKTSAKMQPFPVRAPEKTVAAARKHLSVPSPATPEDPFPMDTVEVGDFKSF